MTQPAAPPPEQPPPGEATALILAAEAALAAAILAAYTAWLAAVTEVVLAAFERFGAAVEATALFALIPDWERRIDAILRDVADMARLGWEQAARDLGLALPFDADDPLLLEQLQRTRNLMVRTPNEVYRMILAELAAAANAGETVAQQAARVRRVLDVTATQNWPARARTVAVTEVNRAFGFGALAAALRAQQRLGPLLKTWQAKDDSGTRAAHRRADGQTVPASQPFRVGGEALMAPGDPSGSPSNVINCRCRPRFSKP